MCSSSSKRSSMPAYTRGCRARVARQLAVQTVLGSVRMLDETGRHTADLKDTVTTPGGTTISGVGGFWSGQVFAAR